MTRKRNKKSHTKTPSPALMHQAHKISPAAQIVANRIASGGVDYMRQNLIRIMTDSVKLADEPEFIDAYLDGEKATEASQRWLKKYEKCLAAAEQKSPDAYHDVFDEMRIDLVAELATPAFRKDVSERLQALLDRLMTTNDLEKLETVMLLKPLLGMRSVPWGLCGLILAIYNRTMQRTIQEYDEEKELYDDVIDVFTAEGENPTDLINLLDTPNRLEELGKKMKEKPGLRQRLENEMLKMAQALENELLEGRVTLDLFTEDELILPLKRIQAELGEHASAFDAANEQMAERSFEIIRQTIIEIMTTKRFQRLRNDVRASAKFWLRERHKWAAALQAELGWLDGEQYEENKFVLAAFLGQMIRLGKEQKPAPKQKKRAN